MAATPVNILFLGSFLDYSASVLEALHNSPLVKVVGVITTPPMPAGRKQELKKTEVQLKAEQLGAFRVEVDARLADRHLGQDVRDPDGHSFGAAFEIPESPNPQEWRACRDYLYGIDLFNHGFYWEAHEAWEGLWVACGRSGATATYLQALITLAAAGLTGGHVEAEAR
jgi:hypothetical protein